MSKLACRYAIVQFQPYPETGEFGNAGIVLVCPKTGYFGYRLETRRYARFTHFFRDLDGQVYLRAINALKDELRRLEPLAKHSTAGARREMFTALVHPRETMVRFSEPRVVMASSPAQELDKLFGYYVEHDFVTHQSHEQQLEKRLQNFVRGLQLTNPFREKRLGDEEYSVVFPLVQMVDQKPNRVIKPFYLGHEKSSEIYNHGDQWVSRLKRLRQRDKLPPEVLFAVEAPPAPKGAKGKRAKAYLEVTEELRQFATIADSSDRAVIAKFAGVS